MLDRRMGNLDRKNRLRKEVRRDDYYKISRLGTYVGVNPHFATLIDFLEKQD